MPFLRIESYKLRFDCNVNSGESAEGRGGEFPLRVPPLLSPNTVVPREESLPKRQVGRKSSFLSSDSPAKAWRDFFFFARLGIKEITLSLWPGWSVRPRILFIFHHQRFLLLWRTHLLIASPPFFANGPSSRSVFKPIPSAEKE